MRIRLSKPAWFLMAAGVFLILLCTLAMTYWREIEAQDELNVQIGTAQQTAAKLSVAELSAQQADLGPRISGVESDIAKVKSSLKQPLDCINAARILYGVAAANGIEVVNISSSGVGSQTVEKIALDSLTMSLKVKGSLQNVIQFMLGLNKDFPTGVLKSVTVDITPEGKAQGLTIASVNLNIHAYEDK